MWIVFIFKLYQVTKYLALDLSILLLHVYL